MTGFSLNRSLPAYTGHANRPWIWLLAGLLAFLWVIGGAAQANAQSRDELAEINKKLVQIEKQLRAVQRVAFPDGKMARDFAASQQGAGAGAGASSRLLLADIEVRLGRIDTQMRGLTGSIEEMAHRQRMLENKFENFRGDMEFRFRELENGGAAAQGDTGSAALAATRPSSGLVETLTPADAVALLERQSLNNAATAPAPALPPGTAEERYKFAFALLRKGDYDKAEAAFRAFVAGHGEHRLAGNAQYWLGETYYVRKDYPRAAAAFLAGFQNYGEGSKGADSLVKLGLTLSNMDQNEDACAAFYEIEVSYPGASEAITRRATSERARLGCE
ncbi:MAG: tol-pal system protein YbgF [Proteobacteria bacterium]|nr:tol-pal system protein YbgF [Pseudomonadota bacterium]